MAAPNLNSSTVPVYGRTVPYAVTTSIGTVLSNGSSSNKSLRITSVRCTNIDGTNSADLNLFLRRGGVDTPFGASGLPFPAKSSVPIVTKEDIHYLEEGDDLRASASANSRLSLLVSYEEIG